MSISKKNEKSASFTELKLITEKILESQTKIQHDIHEIKLNLFDPDNGLYSRVSKNTSFRTAAGKWLWVLTTVLFVSVIQGFIRYVLK